MDDCKCMDRRSFLKLGGLTVVVSAIDPGFARAVGHPGLERFRDAAAASGKTVVFIFQRFGCDGLNVVIPTEPGEYAGYQSFRPTLQIPLSELTPQQLDADFALSPAMKNGIYALWQQGMVGVLPNVGYPNASRSHFDSQMFVDNGTPYQKGTADGWLNRYMQSVPSPGDPLRAVSFSSSLPFSLVGPAPAMSFTDLNALAVAPSNPTRDQKFLDIQGQVYALPSPGRTYDADVASSGAGLVAAINAIRSSPLPAAGPNYPNSGFGRSMQQLAQLIKSKRFAIEIAEVDIGGWDTHSQQQQTSQTGYFPVLLGQMSDAIKAFVDDLNALDPLLMKNTVIVTVSEFGRTARENGNKGTDHGSAWSSFVIGDPTVVKGGKVYMGAGGWSSIALPSPKLRDNRDLIYSVDYRDVFSEVLSKHMGTLNPSIFPGWTYSPIGFL